MPLRVSSDRLVDDVSLCATFHPGCGPTWVRRTSTVQGTISDRLDEAVHVSILHNVIPDFIKIYQIK